MYPTVHRPAAKSHPGSQMLDPTSVIPITKFTF